MFVLFCCAWFKASWIRFRCCRRRRRRWCKEEFVNFQFLFFLFFCFFNFLAKKKSSWISSSVFLLSSSEDVQQRTRWSLRSISSSSYAQLSAPSLQQLRGGRGGGGRRGRASASCSLPQRLPSCSTYYPTRFLATTATPVHRRLRRGAPSNWSLLSILRSVASWITWASESAAERQLLPSSARPGSVLLRCSSAQQLGAQGSSSSSWPNSWAWIFTRSGRWAAPAICSLSAANTTSRRSSKP